MKNAGFTFIEVLLSVAVIAILAGIAAPAYHSFAVRNDLDIAAIEIVQSLRRGQMLAQAVDGDMSWGVNVQPLSITVFKGASYITRDATFDEVFDMPASITPSGIPEIVFSKFSGQPQVAGSIILTSNANEIRIITVNSKGTVSY